MLKRISLWAGLCLCLTMTSVAVADIGTWVANVLAANPEIQSASAAVDAARGQSRASAQPLFNPELEIDYENTDVDTYSGGINQTIDWSGKREARTRVADFELAAIELELQLKRQQLASDLLSGLAATMAAEELKIISEKRSELMGRFADLAKRRREAGDLGQVELDLAHLAAAQSQLEQANAAVSVITERQSLLSITGPSNVKLPALPADSPALTLRNSDSEALLTALPAVRVARSRMDTARSEVSVRLLDKKPDPTVGFRVGRDNRETLAGLTFTLPLYVRNSFSAEVDVANAQLIQAQRDADALMQRSRAAMDAASQRYQILRSAWTNWEKTGKSSLDQQTALLERLWKAGELNTTDYLVQLKQTLDTQATAVEQHGQMWQAWSDWLAASGQTEQWLNIAGVQK